MDWRKTAGIAVMQKLILKCVRQEKDFVQD